MLDWINHVPGWAWLIVIAITFSTIAIDRQLQQLIDLLTELRDHFLPCDDEKPI
jgi:hypothetical protein